MRIIVLCMLLPVLLCGCTPKPETPAVTTARPDRVEILCKALLEAEGLPETTRCDLADTAALYDISEDMLHDARVYRAAYALDAFELAVFDAADAHAREEVEAKIQERLERLAQAYRGTSLGMYAQVRAAKVWVSGTVCAVIIAEDKTAALLYDLCADVN